MAELSHIAKWYGEPIYTWPGENRLVVLMHPSGNGFVPMTLEALREATKDAMMDEEIFFHQLPDWENGEDFTVLVHDAHPRKLLPGDVLRVYFDDAAKRWQFAVAVGERVLELTADMIYFTDLTEEVDLNLG